MAEESYLVHRAHISENSVINMEIDHVDKEGIVRNAYSSLLTIVQINKREFLSLHEK